MYNHRNLIHVSLAYEYFMKLDNILQYSKCTILSSTQITSNGDSLFWLSTDHDPQRPRVHQEAASLPTAFLPLVRTEKTIVYLWELSTKKMDAYMILCSRKWNSEGNHYLRSLSKGAWSILLHGRLRFSEAVRVIWNLFQPGGITMGFKFS